MKFIIGVIRFIALLICIMLLPLSLLGLMTSLGFLGYGIYFKNYNMVSFAFIGVIVSYGVWYLFKYKNWLDKSIDIFDK